MTIMKEPCPETYVDTLLLEQHFPLNVLVVCALGPHTTRLGVGIEGILALVKNKQKLVRHFLLDLDRLIVAHEVEEGWL